MIGIHAIGVIWLENNRIDEAKRLAETDYLTGLANRRALYDYYDALSKDKIVHAMFIDIDNFKRVNDIYGHSMGDELLINISKLIKNCVDGYTARIGGDEYVVLLDGNKSENEVVMIAQLLLESMKDLEFRRDVLSHISLSVGIVLNQCVTAPIDDVLGKCDTAMYQAKYDGKNRYVLYHEYDEIAQRNKNIESEMEEALAAGQFQVYLQPKMNMITSELCGAEALSRWQHPLDGIRSPGVYIPLFEKNGFISRLDMYMFEEVCRIKAEWAKREEPYADTLISVNMSRLHLYDENFAAKLGAIADQYGISHRELEIEITENMFAKDGDELIRSVESVRNQGFYVSIDDFGTGFSALNLLKDLSVDTIKIDRGFLHGSGSTPRGKKIIRNIIAMCLDLKMDVVTEGIETKEQVDFITRCGCQIAQGFYYAKPMSVRAFEKYAEENMIPMLDSYTFHLDGDLRSEDGALQGELIGEGFEYQEGIYGDRKSLYFPGGEAATNVVHLPADTIVNDSYTISMWLKPESLHLWVSSLYVKFEVGFASMLPLAWEGHCDFRIRDSKGVIGWYDVSACKLQEKSWTHFAIMYNAKNETATSFLNGEVAGIMENVPTNRYVQQIILGGDVFQPSFKGNICEVVVYNEAKDYEFMKELYKSYVKKEGFTSEHYRRS